MRRQLVAAVAVAIGIVTAVVIWQLIQTEAPSQFQFEGVAGLRSSAVYATRFNDIIIFHNDMGSFTLPTRCRGKGVGYVTLWTLPDGRVMSQAAASGTTSAANYLNNPAGQPVGVGAVGMYVAFGDPPWQYHDTAWDGRVPQGTSWTTGDRRCGYPGIAWVSDPEIHRTWYRQGIVILRGAAEIDVKWSFTARSVRLDASLQFARVLGQGSQSTTSGGPSGPLFVKEPEAAVELNGDSAIRSVASPGTECPTYSGLVNPARRTGRCEDPRRRVVVLNGFPATALVVQDQDWRRLGAVMQTWQRADPLAVCQTGHGSTGNVFSDFEYPAVAPSVEADYSSVTVLVKAAEGCVNGLQPVFFRRPRPGRPFHLSLTIEPAE